MGGRGFGRGGVAVADRGRLQPERDVAQVDAMVARMQSQMAQHKGAKQTDSDDDANEDGAKGREKATPPKGKAMPPRVKAKGVKAKGIPQFDKNVLIFPGTNQRSPLRYGPSTIYTQKAHGRWVVVLKPGTEKKLSWKNKKPKEVWAQLVNAIKQFHPK